MKKRSGGCRYITKFQGGATNYFKTYMDTGMDRIITNFSQQPDTSTFPTSIAREISSAPPLKCVTLGFLWKQDDLILFLHLDEFMCITLLFSPKMSTYVMRRCISHAMTSIQAWRAPDGSPFSYDSRQIEADFSFRTYSKQTEDRRVWVVACQKAAQAATHIAGYVWRGTIASEAQAVANMSANIPFIKQSEKCYLLRTAKWSVKHLSSIHYRCFVNFSPILLVASLSAEQSNHHDACSTDDYPNGFFL